MLYFTSCIKFTTVSFVNVVRATPAAPPLAVTTACTLISISISISINGQKVVGQKSFALLIRNPIRRLSLFKFYHCKAKGEREGRVRGGVPEVGSLKVCQRAVAMSPGHKGQFVSRSHTVYCVYTCHEGKAEDEKQVEENKDDTWILSTCTWSCLRLFKLFTCQFN